MHRPAQPYTETLRVPPAWWVAGLLVVVAVWWAFFVAGPGSVALAAAAVALAIVVTGLVRYGDATVSIDAGGLRAGRAYLPWRYVGAATALDAEATRRTLGVDADARAYLLTRPYVGCAVRVGVVDDLDPTPYWLISSRKPAELAACLNARVMQD